MKKIAFVIMIMVGCLFTTTLCMAATSEYRVYDYSDLLTDQEEIELEEDIQKIREEWGFDIVILTVDSLEGYSAREYADGFYYENDFGYNDSNDGVIFLVSMGQRDWYIATEGQGDVAINDYCLDIMEEDLIPYLSDANYFKAFDKFVSLSGDFVEQAATGEPYTYNNEYKSFMDYLVRILIVLAVSLIIAGIYLGYLYSTMNNVRTQKQANAYIKEGTFRVHVQKDRFLFSNVTKTAKPKNNGSSGGGGGRGGGGSSGGRGGKF